MSTATKAKCPDCPGEFTTTKAGLMRWHCGTKYVGRWRQMCEGVGKKPAVLHKPWTPTESSADGTTTSNEEQP